MRTIQGTLRCTWWWIFREKSSSGCSWPFLYISPRSNCTQSWNSYILFLHRWLPLKGNDHSQIIIEALLLNTDKTEIPACSWSYRRQFDQVTVTQQLCHFYSYKLQGLQVWMLRYVWSLHFDHFFQQYIKRNHQDF